MQKPVLVIKLGSAVITKPGGTVDKIVIKKISSEIAALSKERRVVLVSSGAVGSGKSALKDYKGSIIERKAAAAVGNPILIQLYHKYFSAYNIKVAQALCERHHFSNRTQFLQLKETFTTFWENDILPVVNENDLVSNVELKFSDNDELATLIAIGFDAETLLICTSAGGFMDAEKKIIPLVQKIDSRIRSFVSTEKSSLGLGGMLSKLTFSNLATSLGIKVIITGLKGAEPFHDALNGNAGTTFIPKQANFKARQKWLASGSITIGSIQVDKGAERALNNRKSLLTVGVKHITGNFSEGEVVQLINEDEHIIGVAKVRLNAVNMHQEIAHKNVLAAHADDIVIF
ncbi:MAG TPA: glutamate 5-kinase [Panacibacter sp.]|nr:glutamate 5-kinase [Panacibacter sp.]HNP44256.1 glutamate 5-kinase [Panacibacter sp.]